MTITPRLQSAIDFMKAAHRSIGQTRKDGVRPYEVHPLEVMERVSEVTDDEDILIAAALHDVAEDVAPHSTTFTLDAIRSLFGRRVERLVFELTDEYTKDKYPEKNRKARKQLERERYATMSPEAKLVKLADVGANLSDDGGAQADVGFMRTYIKEKTLCLPYLFPAYHRREEKTYRAQSVLFDAAAEILKIQKRKFDVR